MSTIDTFQERRNDYDVTNTIQVSSPSAVRDAVREIFEGVYLHSSFDVVWLAFHDFERYFYGLDAEYHGVDTTYHDVQHTLDMTLALARLIAGYDTSVEKRDRLGPDRARLALVCALFHDAGYLRHRVHDHAHANGAELTRSHVSRSGAFLERYLPIVGLAHHAPVAKRIVHFTGYEVNIDRIELDDPHDSVVGHLLGTADLMAQLADRCYLEKCRDRLYPEFVLGGIAVEESSAGMGVRYRSGRDLLHKTLRFYHSSARRRLEHDFNRAYRYVEVLFEGRNPYVEFIHKNLTYLSHVIESGDWDKLRRRPPCVLADPHGEIRLTSLALKRIREIAASEKDTAQRTRVATPIGETETASA